jgi:tRNA dimethylallyltransferase
LTKLLVIIAGPTASGKTRLAIDLAIRFNTEIVSADSRQFFRELSIGTAKPTREELEQVRHHFINSHSITETVTAGIYGTAALNLLNNLFLKHDVIIMVGGSGLYIDAVINGFDDLPPADETTRTKLNNLFIEGGISALQAKLQESDPAAYQKIDVNNPRRLIRALEVTMVTGKPWSEHLGKNERKAPFEWMMAGIEWLREELYKRINERVTQMISAGLKQEAVNVMPYRHVNALSTVGYMEMFDHLDGKLSLDEAADLIAQHTRNYAKRQLTWFKKYPEMTWISPGDESKLISTIENRLRKTAIL